MPRTKKTNNTVGKFTEEAMREAVMLVVEEQVSIRQAAKIKKLSFQTVSRYVRKYHDDHSARMRPNYEVNKIFSNELEKSLNEYIIKCAKMFYGLAINDCLVLAYQLAIKNNLKIPDSWKKEEKATISWLKGFRKRFPNLALRTPEGCSLSRATSFNRHNVSLFFDKLAEVLKRQPVFADGSRIYNLDETGTVTVQKSHKVLAVKGCKQVNKATSAERGTLVTTCCIVSASGNSIPPAMIFPRVHFKEHMIFGAPPGTLGLATKGGWMNSECFCQVLKHFIKHTASSKNNPSLIIMDNHESHIALEAIDLCKANGVVILTIPPHCTNKLQPLDVGILKPFHTYYNAAIDSWMMAHPAETFSIYNVASCVGVAYPKAMTPVNITAAFKKTGIFPYDRHIFTDDFLPSSITDRPLEESGDTVTVPQLESLSAVMVTESTSTLSTSGEALQPQDRSIFTSPEQVRPYPKAGPRKTKSKCRKKGKTMIATDTPERQEIENKRNCKKPVVKKIKRKLFKRDVKYEDSDADETEMILQDSSDDETFSLSEFLAEDDNDDFEDSNREPTVGEYILVKFDAKNPIYYVGQVLSNKNASSEFEVKYLRQSSKSSHKFFSPDIADVAMVLQSDITLILPKPISHGLKTKRQNAYISFDINLESFNIR